MKLSEIKALSPVQIIYKPILSHWLCNGLYFSCDIPPRIEVENSLNGAKLKCVMLHEIGHAIHHKQNCRCMQNRNNHTLAEYHAFKFAMGHIEDDEELAECFVNEILKNALGFKGEHKIAARQLAKLKLWKKLCLNNWHN